MKPDGGNVTFLPGALFVAPVRRPRWWHRLPGVAAALRRRDARPPRPLGEGWTNVGHLIDDRLGVDDVDEPRWSWKPPAPASINVTSFGVNLLHSGDGCRPTPKEAHQP